MYLGVERVSVGRELELVADYRIFSSHAADNNAAGRNCAAAALGRSMLRMDDTQTEVPGHQSLDDVAPMSRAQIDEALRGGTANGQAAKPARGPGGQFIKKGPALDEPVPVPAAAAAADRADEARLVELAGELEADDDGGCVDCGKPVDGMGRGLGVVVLAAGVTLCYIGVDLLMRGGLSRRVGGGARWDDQQ